MTQSNRTQRSAGWKVMNSLWTLFLLAPLGLGTFPVFFFIGIRAKVRNWIISGVVYLIVVITGFVLINYFEDEHILTDIGAGLIIVAWMTAIGHGFSVRNKYLQIISGNSDVNMRARSDVQRDSISIINAEQVREQQQKSSSHEEKEPRVININIADENEISQLPLIHSFLAKEIINIRNDVKVFNSLDHFARTTNIQPHILSKAKEYIVFTDADLKKSINTESDQEESHSQKTKGRVVDY